MAPGSTTTAPPSIELSSSAGDLPRGWMARSESGPRQVFEEACELAPGPAPYRFEYLSLEGGPVSTDVGASFETRPLQGLRLDDECVAQRLLLSVKMSSKHARTGCPEYDKLSVC